MWQIYEKVTYLAVGPVVEEFPKIQRDGSHEVAAIVVEE